jgi:hypothetical protein
VKSSRNTGRKRSGSTMSELSAPANFPAPASSAVVSPVKTSVTQGLAPASTANDLDYGESTSGSYARFDPNSSSWKTSQLCLGGDSQSFLETLPPSGLMRSGQLFPRAPWVRHICDDACSLWPTPTASMDGRGFGVPLHEAGGRYKRSTVLRVQDLVKAHGWRIHPNFTEALMGFPIEWSAIGQ